MSGPAPAVSIVLPTYNRASVLPRAIASVLNQTCRDFELIVVDDASSDGTDTVLAGYAANPRLRVLRQPVRGGAAAARNAGIHAARAELIAFQDSDDEWLVDKLRLQLERLNAGGGTLGWVGGAYLAETRGALTAVRSEALCAGRPYDEDLLIGASFVTPTWLVRKSALEVAGLFDTTLPCLEDWDLILKLADQCRFAAVPDYVLFRHGSADSLYGDAAKRAVGLEAVLTRHRRRWLAQPRRYGAWCAELGRLQALQERPEARRWLREGLRHGGGLRASLLAGASLAHPRLLRRIGRSRHMALPPPAQTHVRTRP